MALLTGGGPIALEPSYMETTGSPPSDTSNVSVFLNMSPMQRRTDPAVPTGMLNEASLPMASSLRSAASSSDTLAFTSTGPSSLSTSRAPSQRESLGFAEAAEYGTFFGSAGDENSAAPVAQLASMVGGLDSRALRPRSTGADDGQNIAQPTSKVAQMRDLFEKRLSTKSSRGTADSHAAAWTKCASDMVRRLRHEELRTSRMTDRLMKRIKEIDGTVGGAIDWDAAIVQGTGSASPRRSNESSSEGEDGDAPMMQLHRRMMAYHASHFRTYQQIYESMLHVMTLDQRGADGDVSNAVEARETSALALGSGVLATSAIDQAVQNDLPISSRAVQNDLPISSRASTEPRQPEEEADETLPEQATQKDAKEADEAGEFVALCGGPPVDDPEPAREPQPKDSPRETMTTSNLSSPRPRRNSSSSDWSGAEAAPPHEHPAVPRTLLESSEKLRSSQSQPQTVEKEPDDEPCEAANMSRHEEPSWQLEEVASRHEASGEVSMVDHSTSSGDAGEEISDMVALDCGGGLDRTAVQGPRAYEDSLHRRGTMLHQIEQSELTKSVTILVPDGMGEDRKVNFFYENVKFDIIVPEGNSTGDEVTILVPKRPPLERSRTQAYLRDHCHFPDFVSIWNVVRHPPTTSLDVFKDSGFKCDEVKVRLQQYKQMGGRYMAPLLPFMPEDEDEAGMPGEHFEEPVRTRR